MPLASACVASWVREVPFTELLILNDGTLSAASIERLEQLDLRARIVSREESADIVSSKLRWNKYPGLRRLAETQPIARKLIDVPIMGDEWINYIDSDVFFYRGVDTLWTQQVNDRGVWMMRDFQSAYAVARWQYIPGLGPKLPKYANTGLISCSAKCFDPDFLESVIKRHFSDSRLSSWLTEQTLWAAMAFRHGLSFYDSQLFALAVPEQQRRLSNVVALHWATPFRNVFREGCSAQPGAGRVMHFRLEPAERLTCRDVYSSFLKFSVDHEVARLRRVLGN